MNNEVQVCPVCWGAFRHECKPRRLKNPENHLWIFAVLRAARFAQDWPRLFEGLIKQVAYCHSQAASGKMSKQFFEHVIECTYDDAPEGCEPMADVLNLAMRLLYEKSQSDREQAYQSLVNHPEFAKWADHPRANKLYEQAKANHMP